MGKLEFLLSHHPREQCADKCFHLSVGAGIPICSRCLGLYPTAITVIILDFTILPPLSLSFRALAFWFFVLPAWYHWAREHYERKPWGGKWRRLGSGVLSGIGTALLLGGHFKHPYNGDFLFSGLLLLLISACVVFLEWFFRPPPQ
ncbi:DUF2085 domain-containing protein [Myxococcota bacterium]|nr:DUF2085 domain-containing protein [Myxococcota bacterium]MBU1537376.1 DUF2085 domain-containing protein [Myxococcota bacterium]